MATVNKFKTDAPNKAKAFSYTSGAGTFELANDIKGEFTHFVLNGSGKVTFKAGSGYMGVKDLEITVGSQPMFVTIDTSRFVDADGKIKIVTTSNATFAVCEARI